ncbi:virulence factor, partial [Bacillus sp. SIMBA_069]
IVKEVSDELIAAYPEERINRLVAAAIEMVDTKETFLKRPKNKLTAEMLNDESWEKRYQALEQMEDPTVGDIPVLDMA